MNPLVRIFITAVWGVVCFVVGCEFGVRLSVEQFCDLCRRHCMGEWMEEDSEQEPTEEPRP